MWKAEAVTEYHLQRILFRSWWGS